MPNKVKSKLNPPTSGPNLGWLLNFPERIISYRPSKNIYFIILIAGLLLLAIYKKSWFIAAMVNSQPITNLELQMRLNQQFRNQTLNQLINEKIILSEATKTENTPTEEEITKKIFELETQVGGKETLDTLLTQQGQTRITLREQIRLQLAIAKLYDKEATVSAEEIEKFIEQNEASLRATDSASQQKETYDLLKQQKLSEIFNQKFQELKQKAKIQIF